MTPIRDIAKMKEEVSSLLRDMPSNLLELTMSMTMDDLRITLEMAEASMGLDQGASLESEARNPKAAEAKHLTRESLRATVKQAEGLLREIAAVGNTEAVTTLCTILRGIPSNATLQRRLVLDALYFCPNPSAYEVLQDMSKWWRFHPKGDRVQARSLLRMPLSATDARREAITRGTLRGGFHLAEPIKCPSQPAKRPAPPTTRLVASTPPPLDPQLALVCDAAARGEPTTFISYGSDEALFLARLRPFTAYAATRGGKLTILGIQDKAGRDCMIIQQGSRDEDQAFSRAALLDQLDEKLLSPAELEMRRPVNADSNFAQPGCTLTSMDGFNRCLRQARSGSYAVVAVTLPEGLVESVLGTEAKVSPVNAEGPPADLADQVRTFSDLLRGSHIDAPLTRLDLREVLGSQAIAWLCPDDGTEFPSDYALQILKGRFPELTSRLRGPVHSTGGPGQRMIAWFFADA